MVAYPHGTIVQQKWPHNQLICLFFFLFDCLLWPTHTAKTDKEKQPHVKQPTAEQIRIAQITEVGTSSDDPKMREKVASLMETTQRTEEEVCCALYECDYDLDRAVIFLFETLPVVGVV